MNKCLLLTKLLLKAGIGSFSDNAATSQKRKRRINSQWFLYLLVAICLVPFIVMLYQFGKELYSSLDSAGLAQLAFSLATILLSLSTLIFSIPYVMSVMFFSTDTEFFASLPVTSWHIAGGKFLTILVYEYYTVALFGIPLFAGIGAASNASPVFWIIALIVLLLIPILPLTYGSLMGLLLLRGIKGRRNKEMLMTVFSILVVIASLAFGMFSSSMGDQMDEHLLMDMIVNNRQLITGVDYLFPNLRFARAALMENNFLMLLIYVLTCLVVLGFYLLLANGLYLKSIAGMSESSEHRRKLTKTQQTKELKSHGLVNSLASREWKLLVRTPIYMLNCFLTVILIPPLLFFPLASALFQENDFTELLGQMKALLNEAPLSVIYSLGLLLVFFFSTLTATMNLTASTCISREGQNYITMKYIPVPYRIQIKAKLLCSLRISFAAILPYVIVLVLASCYFLGTPLFMLFPACLVCIFTILLISYIQILGDLWKPKLVWLSEQEAVKKNLVSTLSMLVCWLICGLLGGGLIFLAVKGVSCSILLGISLPLLVGVVLGLRVLTYRFGEQALNNL